MTEIDATVARALRASRKAGLPLFRLGSAEAVRDMALTTEEILALVNAGVPAHLALKGRQDEHPEPRSIPRRVAAGESLFLVQPHEYMPRLRRWIHHAGRALGLSGRPVRSFLFLVDRPGRPAMPLHDDAENELLWLQLDGERFVRFGPPGEAVAPVRPQPVREADGRHGGWFEGGLPAGSLLYLPPWTPHAVRCRKRSVALSVYWEPARAADRVPAWLHHLGLGEAPAETPAQLERLLTRAASHLSGDAAAEWGELLATDDGARDRPAAGRRGDRVAAWRAFSVREGKGSCTLLAGPDRALTFPRAVTPALVKLAHYGSASVGELEAVVPARSRAKLPSLLAALHGEGLITWGDLPKIGEFAVDELTGGEFSAQ